VHQLQQIALHEIQAEVNYWRFVLAAALVDHLVDVENMPVFEGLQDLYLADCCYRETHLAVVVHVLHLLQSVVVSITQTAGLVHRTVGTTPQLALAELVAGVEQGTLPLLRCLGLYYRSRHRLFLHSYYILCTTFCPYPWYSPDHLTITH
jgi:hypothetical protein